MKLKNALVKSLILFILLLQACGKNSPEKENEKPPVEEEKPGPLANKLRSQGKTENSPDNYFYNSDGTLSREEFYEYDNVKLSFQNKYYYKNNKRSASTFAADYSLGDTLTVSYRHDVTWTGNQITEVLEDWPYLDSPKGIQLANRELSTFSYDAKGFIKSIKIEWVKNGTKTRKQDLQLTTDGRGNLIKAEITTYDMNGDFMHSSTEVREYDDKVNPKYKLLSPISYFAFFSPNNVTKISGETTYTYKYNAAGLPIEETRKKGAEAAVVSNFYYHK
ncbi:MAG TPA: hypothetical protein VKB19_01435 [Pedobacter sp.]|nr:hypothetical protein [Pedobacter sp.]